MMGKVGKQEKQAQKTMEALADWLLDGVRSFPKLDSFRRRLGLDSDAFSEILGVSHNTFAKWRTSGGLPLFGRDDLHSAVCSEGAMLVVRRNLGFEADSGTSWPQIFRPAVGIGDTPVKVSFRTHPHCYLPRPKAFEKYAREESENLARIQVIDSHRPIEGDDYESCECEICVA